MRRLAPVVVAVILTGLLNATPAAQAAGPLISQGKPTTASSTENAGTPASAATDGNAGTRWSSAFSDPQWIQIDLGATAAIDQVILNWEAAYARSFSLGVSDSATGPFTTIYSTTTSTGGLQTLAVTGNGRYIRMTGTVRATQYGYSLWEFQVFGTTGSPPGECNTGTNTAQGKPATASSTQSAGFPASAAVDGSLSTRWSSAFSDPQWIQIDLGSSVTVCRVVLAWEAAYARAYSIGVSDNPAGPFTTIHSTTTSTGGTQTLNITGTGRYLRVTGTVRATGFGYSLWEVTVNTTGGSTPPGG
ncbi:MAG TPA: discoidin domain-containing protein, partial [Candidatus Limnocylindrales bacterium]|nr:discoidin domain-containing protein [Candidatus Limnocylindrales bacterium]